MIITGSRNKLSTVIFVLNKIKMRMAKKGKKKKKSKWTLEQGIQVRKQQV